MNKLLVLVGLGCTVLSGCASCKDYQYELVQSCHANWGWYQVGKKCNGSPYPKHYRAGWKAGYKDVALGGCGLLPPVPPEKYWKARYENCEGQQRVAAWFQGFQQGAIAAEQRCEKTWHPVPTSGLVALPQVGCECSPSTCRVPACCESGHVVPPPAELMVPPMQSPLAEQPLPANPPRVEPNQPTEIAKPAASDESLPAVKPIPVVEPKVAPTAPPSPNPLPTPQASITPAAKRSQSVVDDQATTAQTNRPVSSMASQIAMIEIAKLFGDRQSTDAEPATDRYAGYHPATSQALPAPSKKPAQIAKLARSIVSTRKTKGTSEQARTAKVKPVQSPQPSVVASRAQTASKPVAQVVPRQVPVVAKASVAAQQVFPLPRKPALNRQLTAIANPQTTHHLTAQPADRRLPKQKPSKTEQPKAKRPQMQLAPIDPLEVPLIASEQVPAAEKQMTALAVNANKPTAAKLWVVPAQAAKQPNKQPQSTVKIVSIKSAQIQKASSASASQSKTTTIGNQEAQRRLIALKSPVQQAFRHKQASELRIVPAALRKPIVLTNKQLKGSLRTFVR